MHNLFKHFNHRPHNHLRIAGFEISLSLSPVRFFSARESLARQCTRLAAMYDAEDEFAGMMLPLDLPRQCEQASSISQLKIDQVDRITICLVRKTNKKKN